jgi:hypothetical protein
VKAGAYKKVSASFYPKDHPNNPTPGVYALRHVGFLGAQPPAVKGLKPTEFAEEADCIEIELDFAEEQAAGQSEWKFPSAEPTTPQPTTAENPAEPSSLPSGAAAAADGIPEGSTHSQPETTTVTPEEKAALEAHNAQLQADLDASRAAINAQAAAANTAAHAAFAEKLVGEARITAAEAPLLVATLDHLEPPTVAGERAALVEFGEGEAKKPMAEVFKAFLQSLPKRVEFGEQAGRDRAATGEKSNDTSVQYAEGTPQESIDLDTRIRAYAKANKLSYAEATMAVVAAR